jgi:hypothetical protein
MLLLCYSQSAKNALARFRASIFDEVMPQRSLLRQRAAFCTYKVFLVTPDNLEFNETADEDMQDLAVLHQKWQSVFRNKQGSSLSRRELQEVNEFLGQIVEVILHPDFDLQETQNGGRAFITHWLLRARKPSDTGVFYILLEGNEQFGIPLRYVNFLSNMWQIEQGCMPVHAAGFILNGYTYLFAGPSGAGKSTILAHSRKIGGKVLDEDQVLLRLDNNKRITADAWGYNIISCDVPLRAIFILKKSLEDRLKPLPKAQVAHCLLEGQLYVVNMPLPDRFLSHSLGFAAEIARQIPGYELQFRKSPDFWKLIDELFPD